MTLEDFSNHVSTFDTPIRVNYRGVDVWEIPPNGQGITALIALNILEGFDLKSLKHNSPQYLHLLVEARTYYLCNPLVHETSLCRYEILCSRSKEI